MGQKQEQNRGVLLGMAVGDAMGHTVDRKSLPEILADYGPNGLLGYDLVNGYADITSYSQLAAFTANGLLLGLTRGQAQGRMHTMLRYITAAIREWSRSQSFSLPEKKYCWLSGVPEMKRKFCMDNRMLDALNREALGSLEEPKYKSDSPGSLTAVIAIALLRQELELSQEELDRLGAQTVALTHGEPAAYLSGAALTHLLCGLLDAPETPIAELVHQTVDSVGLQFGQGGALWELLQLALTLAVSPNVTPMEAMQNLGCRTAAEVLAGAVYTVSTCNRDFDTAMITAVNHSGRSSAVGAIAGAMLGAMLGDEALPEFYLESLEAAQPLAELANDLSSGFSEMVGKSLFDMDWDRKYLSIGK